MVGIVVVSHSDALAEGVVALARQMADEGLKLEAAGGAEEPGVLGTDPQRVLAAIERAMSPDGVLVLMDLGSALMSADLAIELLGDGAGPVRLSEAPLVEGTVVAAVAASGGATLEDVAAEARGALAMKSAQLGVEEPQPSSQPATRPAAPDAEAMLLVRNEIGLHARPAARFVAIARGFDADVLVAKGPGAVPVSATSLTNVIGLGARFGDAVTVTASGPQAAAAIEALRALADDGFGDGISARASTPPAAAPAVSVSAPPGSVAVREAPVPGAILRGVPASRGIVVGAVHQLHAAFQAPAERVAEPPERERHRLSRGIAAAREGITRDRDLVARRAGPRDAEIFDAHLALLDDEAVLEPAYAAIDASATAERAWYDAAQHVAAGYRALEVPLLRERAADVLDVGRRVVDALTGASAHGSGPAGIVIADELTPADAAALDPEIVLGVAAARGSATAHAAILARALGLPAVVGLGDAVLGIEDGTHVLLDAEEGILQVDPPAEVVRTARERRARAEERRRAALARAHEPGATRDGTRVEVFANLGAAPEAARAVELGAEGVGLLRTEFLFLDRAELPGEEEQAETLREIARALDGRPLIVRTLDAGADKPLPALPMPAEANPFLGVRGVRLTLARPDLLRTQFRAILRVASEHPLKAMLPMVATAEEIVAARAVLEQARSDTGVRAPLELGIMVEIPAAALSAAALAEHADFFSLGTNDLTQYTMAAERGDERLAGLLSGPQPAVLQLVRATVDAAASRGRMVGVCGELAGDPAAAVLLVGLGVGELSMAPALVPELKAALREVDISAARQAAAAALQAADVATARALAAGLL
jgi:phosphocarrier protein FPr